jgi:hypothetical protein
VTALRLGMPSATTLELPRDEMAFRGQYRELLLMRTLKTVFRPGDRIFPSWRGYEEGEIVTARIIRTPGSDERGVPPQFDALRIPIRILDLKLCAVSALEPADFAGSSPDVIDQRSLLSHLHGIYGRSIWQFANRVTRIEFDYVD